VPVIYEIGCNSIEGYIYCLDRPSRRVALFHGFSERYSGMLLGYRAIWRNRRALRKAAVREYVERQDHLIEVHEYRVPHFSEQSQEQPGAEKQIQPCVIVALCIGLTKQGMTLSTSQGVRQQGEAPGSGVLGATQPKEFARSRVPIGELDHRGQ